jgi:hypothetical protein
LRARDNPFRADRIDGLAFRDPDVTADGLLADWRCTGRRGALVGPHGTGKTTLLAELIDRLQALGQPVVAVRLSADETADDVRDRIVCAIEAARPDRILCIDGFDLLPWGLRRRIARADAGLCGVLVTSHRACALPTLHRTRTSPALLEEIVGELTGRRDPSRKPRLERLYADHAGNLRDALFALYAEAAAEPAGPAPSRSAQ